MVVIDTHLARGASNGGFTFHDRGGPYGRTKGAKRVVAVDVTGLPVAALVVPASTHENRASELMLEHLTRQGVTNRLELVLVDRGVTAAAARTLSRHHDLEVRRSGGTTSSRSSAPSGTPGASRSPTAASDAPAAWRSRSRTPPPQRPAGSRSRASPRRCATCHESEPAGVLSRSQLDHARSRTARKRQKRRFKRFPRGARRGILGPLCERLRAEVLPHRSPRSRRSRPSTRRAPGRPSLDGGIVHRVIEAQAEYDVAFFCQRHDGLLEADSPQVHGKR